MRFGRRRPGRLPGPESEGLYSRVMYEPHSVHLISKQGAPLSWGLLCPHFGQTQYPPGPRPRPPPMPLPLPEGSWPLPFPELCPPVTIALSSRERPSWPGRGLMIAGVVTRHQGVAQVLMDQGLRIFRGRPGEDLDAFLSKQILGPAPHASRDNYVGALLVEPFR